MLAESMKGNTSRGSAAVRSGNHKAPSPVNAGSKTTDLPVSTSVRFADCIVGISCIEIASGNIDVTSSASKATSCLLPLKSPKIPEPAPAFCLMTSMMGNQINKLDIGRNDFQYPQPHLRYNSLLLTRIACAVSLSTTAGPKCLFCCICCTRIR